ncbi:MAG: GNAT family N-acetyltransferase [Candidatus Omnitrophota bacterium]|nr:GNAT family N-acetyltransferase [Candidatus Omnitrophota bacterium]
MKEFRVVTELDRKKWADFVYNHPNGNIFQTPEMFEAYKNTKNWQPLFLSAVDCNDNICGLLLTVIQSEFGGFFSRCTARAIVWGGPLLNPITQCSSTASTLLAALNDALAKKVLYIQFRNLWDLSEEKKYFINMGYIYKEHLNFMLDLSKGETQLWQGLYSSKRNKIRNAEKENVKVIMASSGDETRASYDILKDTYQRIRLPLADKSLFDFLQEFLIPKGMLKIFLAKYSEKIIGALYLLAYKEKLYVWFAASLTNYYAKHPNDILYWEAIRWGCQNNYKIFDFGGAGSPNNVYGVREFKKEYGGQLVCYGRFEKTIQPFVAKIMKINLNLWRIFQK